MSTNANENAAAAVRAEMARQGMSTRALADKLGTSQMWVYRRKSGEVPLSISELHEFASALGVSPDVLLAQPSTP